MALFYFIYNIMKNKLKSLIEPSGMMFREKYIITHHKDIYDDIMFFIIDNCLNELQFKQQVYHYLNDIKEIQRCKNPNCNNNVKYINSNIGYLSYCCKKCISTDPEIIKKKEETCLVKYGTKHQSSNQDIKDKKKKTNKQNFGFDTPLENKEFYEKSRNTLFKNFGVYHPQQSEEIKIKTETTNTILYGFKTPLQNEYVKTKCRNTKFVRYNDEYYNNREQINNT